MGRVEYCRDGQKRLIHVTCPCCSKHITVVEEGGKIHAVRGIQDQMALPASGSLLLGRARKETSDKLPGNFDENLDKLLEVARNGE